MFNEIFQLLTKCFLLHSARDKAHRDSYKKVKEEVSMVESLFPQPKEPKGKGKTKVSLTWSIDVILQ